MKPVLFALGILIAVPIETVSMGLGLSDDARYRTEIDGEIAVVNAVDGGALDFDEEEYCEEYCYEPGTLSLDLERAHGLVPLGHP